MLENSKKFENSPNLLLLFVKITKFLEFSAKITIKTIVFSNSGEDYCIFRIEFFAAKSRITLLHGRNWGHF